MRSENQKLIEVAAEKRMEKGEGIAIFDGTMEGTREKWVWLPKRLVEDHGDGTFTMPEWLAKEKGLI